MTLTTPWKKPTTRPPVHLVELDKAGILIKISVCKFKFVFFLLFHDKIYKSKSDTALWKLHINSRK